MFALARVRKPCLTIQAAEDDLHEVLASHEEGFRALHTIEREWVENGKGVSVMSRRSLQALLINMSVEELQNRKQVICENRPNHSRRIQRTTGTALDETSVIVSRRRRVNEKVAWLIHGTVPSGGDHLEVRRRPRGQVAHGDVRRC
jgi:hypothetical protein